MLPRNTLSSGVRLDLTKDSPRLSCNWSDQEGTMCFSSCHLDTTISTYSVASQTQTSLTPRAGLHREVQMEKSCLPALPQIHMSYLLNGHGFLPCLVRSECERQLNEGIHAVRCVKLEPLAYKNAFVTKSKARDVCIHLAGELWPSLSVFFYITSRSRCSCGYTHFLHHL